MVSRSAFNQALGRLLKSHRTRLGLTQAELAFHTGTDTPNVCRIEKGNTAPSVHFVWSAATALCMSPGELMREAAAIAAQSAIP
jgi:transcriptional regulator with XRE-family HTH domain